MVLAAGAGSIAARRGTHSLWAEPSLRLFLAALAPLAVAAPLRAFVLPDDSNYTVLLVGPALEESLKLAAVVLVLTLASMTQAGVRDPPLVLRHWLFWAPWVVGGAYGMIEGLVVYPGQGGLDFTLREFAHATFVALAFAAALRVWARVDAPLFGIGVGFASGYAAHLWFNALALLSDVIHVSFADQALYLAVVFAATAVLLTTTVRREPASAEARAFLPAQGRVLHP